MHALRTWTIAANLSPAALKIRAIKAFGIDPGVRDSVWASVSAIGGTEPPEWMLRLERQLAKEYVLYVLY